MQIYRINDFLSSDKDKTKKKSIVVSPTVMPYSTARGRTCD